SSDLDYSAEISFASYIILHSDDVIITVSRIDCLTTFFQLSNATVRPLFSDCAIDSSDNLISFAVSSKIFLARFFLDDKDFERSTGFDDTALIKISQKCDKLQFLNISFSEDITGKSFCEIAQSCNGLKHLGINIRSSSRLTDTAIYTLTDLCPNLRSLKLEYYDEINNIAIRKIAYCHYLKHLELYSIKALSGYYSLPLRR
ncbi:6598_t:CDS:2, partial [Funneliformis caledonium]